MGSSEYNKGVLYSEINGLRQLVVIWEKTKLNLYIIPEHQNKFYMDQTFNLKIKPQICSKKTGTNSKFMEAFL